MQRIDFSLIMKKLKSYPFPKTDLIVGLETGGTIPAAIVSYLLDVPVVYMRINFRDLTNTPQRVKPAILKLFRLPKGVKRVLIVDDVSVTGQTLAVAGQKLKQKGCIVSTFVLKGRADHVLFPKIKNCVLWPWKQ